MTRHAIYLCALALTAAYSCTGHRNATAVMSPEPTRQPVAGSGTGAAAGADAPVSAEAHGPAGADTDGVARADSLVATTGADTPVGVSAPKAVAYRMSGDYADNVPVTLAADGAIISYPAPGDLTDLSAPLPLADGWWLDRRGISANSVFTRYTYSEYRALPAAPTPAELKASVIPGARVTATLQLPMTVSKATADTAAANAAISHLAPRFIPTPATP